MRRKNLYISEFLLFNDYDETVIRRQDVRAMWKSTSCDQYCIRVENTDGSGTIITYHDEQSRDRDHIRIRKIIGNEEYDS